MLTGQASSLIQGRQARVAATSTIDTLSAKKLQKYDGDPAAKAAAATVLGIQVRCGLHSGDESRANVAQDNELLHQNPQAYVAQDGNWIARIAALLVGED